MEAVEFYGPYLAQLEGAMEAARRRLESYGQSYAQSESLHSIVYIKSRLKSPGSIMAKLEQRGLPATAEAALEHLGDTIGLRAVCAYTDDVYALAQWIEAQELWTLVKKKDYISRPKPNGYRSLHLLLEMRGGDWEGLRLEIQLRTMAIDFWATLEHGIRYKHQVAYEKTIGRELKRCADEIASLDLSMQAIRDFLREERA